MPGRPIDRAAGVFAAGVLVACDPSATILPTPLSWLVVTTGAALLTALAVAGGTLRLPPRAVGWSFVALLCWLAVAAAWGKDGRFGWLGIPQRHGGWLLWAICGLMLVCGPSLRAVSDGMVAAGVLWLPTLVAGAAGADGWVTASGRLVGPFGSAAYLGAAATLVAPVALGVALDRDRAHWWRGVAGVAAAAGLFAIVGSGSRAAWVGTMIGVVVAAAGLARRRSPRDRLPTSRGNRGAVLASAAAAAVVVVLAALATPAGSRAASAFTGDGGGGASRLDEWRVAVAVVAEYPLVGAGPEGYRIVVREGVDAGYERAYGRSVQPDRAHQAVLDMAVSGGIPAAVLLLGVWATAARAFRRRRAGGLVTVALAAYLGQQQFLFPLAEVEPVVFLLAGAALAERPWRLPPVPRVGLTVVACAAAAVAAWAGVRDVRAWSAAAGSVAAAHAGDPVEAHREALVALGWRGDEVWLHLLRSAVAATPEEALAAVDDALALSPGDPIAQVRRMELLTTLDPARAADEIDVLLADDPYHATLHLLRGTAAIHIGDEVVAEQEWLVALDLAPAAVGPRANLITLYTQQGRLDDAAALQAAGEGERQS